MSPGERTATKEEEKGPVTSLDQPVKCREKGLYKDVVRKETYKGASRIKGGTRV